MENNNIQSEFDVSLDDIFSRLDIGQETKKTERQPFKFLDSYTKEDSDIFFGREEETDDVYCKFYQSKILLIYGRSGTGKSSVVSCGLLNKIPLEDIYPIKICCGKEAYAQFVQDIRKHTSLNSIKPNEILQDIYEKNSKPILLLFDQFEEIFILSTSDKRKQLIDTLKQLIESRLKINIIFVIREEYLAHLTEFETVVPTLFQNRMRIERLHRTKAVEVIENPCKVCGIAIKPGVSELITDKLTDDKGRLELTYLQVLMDRLYKKVIAENFVKITIQKKHFDALKSIGNVLTQYVDEQLHAMPNAMEGERILKTMVSADGTKRRMNIDEISNNLKMTGSALSANELQDVLQYFVNARIISDKDEHNDYELRHDALAARIYERMTAMEKKLIEIRQFIDNAYHNFLKRSVLFSATDLEYIAPFENKLYLSGKTNDFLIKSKNEIQRIKRRKRNIVLTAASLFVVLVTSFAIFALVLMREAQVSEKKAIENERVAKQQEQEAKTQLDNFLKAERARKKAEVEKLIEKIELNIGMNQPNVRAMIEEARSIQCEDSVVVQKLKKYK